MAWTGQAGPVTLSPPGHLADLCPHLASDQARRRGHKKGVLKPLPTLAQAGRNLRNVKVQT